jgi:glycosyltransferase involved in cell wall biosynthesis
MSDIDELCISVVLPTYREKESIRSIAEGFLKLNFVKEVIVVNNNAEPGTDDVLKDLDVRIVREVKQGYGFSIKAGITEARFEYICICEPDGTFIPNDIRKLISYLSDYDLVVGSRTESSLIWSGANMTWPLQWGNWFAAKVVQLFFNTSSLTDVGCTFRIGKAELIKKSLEHSMEDGNAFGLEMMLIFLVERLGSFIQIPINYLPRIGESSVTGKASGVIKVGLKMFYYIVIYLKIRIKKSF